MSNLAIENNPELLQEYGRAFACINAVEELLRMVLRTKDRTKRSEELGIPLGALIDLIREDWLDETVVERLRNLNKDRKKLAHGVVGEIVDDSLSSAVSSGRFILIHKSEGKLFNRDFLQRISKDAKELIGELYQILPIPKK